MTRRDAIKAAAVGTAAAGTLASPALAGANALLEQHRRESSCRCQDAADKRLDNNIDSLENATGINNPLSLLTPIPMVLYVAGGAGAMFGWGAAKLACGTCDRSPSGGKKPAPPNFTPCSPRGGVRRGPECPGGGGSGGSNNDCPPNTTRCTLTLCCYGSDVCCSCGGEATCCIAEVGCGCC